MPIGIMSAMNEEIYLLHQQMDITNEFTIGGRTYYTGTLWGKQVVLVFSRWGKVAAASTTTTLIERFKIDGLLFSGVAGAIHSDLKIGDIVIGERLVQHDMDASPLFDKYEIPLTQKKFFDTDRVTRELLHSSARKFVNAISLESNIKHEFKIQQPTVKLADIASGDKFISNTKDIERINKELSSICCVEMEGAAVAQVCYENDIHFGIIRIISDTADESAHIDFQRFIEEVASHYTLGILKEYFSEN